VEAVPVGDRARLPAVRGALAALILLHAALAVDAEGGAFSIDRFAATIRINPDSSLSVREDITFAFVGRHHGIYRTIPVRELRHGLEWALRLDQIHAWDEQGGALRTEVSHRGSYVKIKAWVPGATNTRRTVTLGYRVRRGLLAWDGADELYWNVTGTEWGVSIGSAEAYIAMPATVTPELVRAVAYTGSRDSRQRDYALDWSGRVLMIRATRPLAPREGLTLSVSWPRGHTTRPSATREAWWQAVDNWPLGLPLFVLGVMAVAWRRYGRDPAARRSIMPLYQPPTGLIPAEASGLLDHRIEPRDVVATIVDLAVRGYLHLSKVTTAFGEPDFLFKRTRLVYEAGELKPLEVHILLKLFGMDWRLNLRLLSEVRQDFASTFPDIRDRIFAQLVADGLYPASPRVVRALWASAGALLVGLGAVLALRDPEALGALGWELPLGVTLSGLIVMAMSWVMPRRTWRGVYQRVRLLGFREFLERAEKDRLERLPADAIHKWLPWAMALGVTERWLIHFRGLTVEPPAWYTGDGPFALDAYGRDLATFSRRTEALVSSGPGDGAGGAGSGGGDGWSKGSGSSGGSSGGGLGGGGGGTF
jgi:uncharacterized membrane protein YgcG